jgi:serine/threonine protein kinase
MLRFLRQVAEAVAEVGIKRLAGGILPLSSLLMELASKVVERYQLRHELRQIRSDFEEMLQSHRDQLCSHIKLVVREVLPQGQPEEQRQLEDYLLLVPEMARRSLSRPEDREGKTVPPALRLEEPAQLVQLLPQRFPQFTAGQPLPGAESWQLVKLLGVGGFGEVWLARHAVFGMQWAVKFCLDPQARRQLLTHEGQVVQQIRAYSEDIIEDVHGIVPLLDARLDVEPPWLAYEYVDGGDLADVIAQLAQEQAQSRGQKALDYVVSLGQVVGKLHRLQPPIVHRDLKPSNILLKRTKRGLGLRVSDFGISQLAADRQLQQALEKTRLGSRVTVEHWRGAYTPLYASPQQERGLPPDVRDDVYSLGIIAWQLLTGDVQRGRPSGREARRLICNQCQLPEAVVEVLECSWDNDPNERPTDGLALAEALQRARKTKADVAAVPPSSPPATLPETAETIQDAQPTNDHQKTEDQAAPPPSLSAPMQEAAKATQDAQPTKDHQKTEDQAAPPPSLSAPMQEAAKATQDAQPTRDHSKTQEPPAPPSSPSTTVRQWRLWRDKSIVGGIGQSCSGGGCDRRTCRGLVSGARPSH